jgi:hypothetical protein
MDPLLLLLQFLPVQAGSSASLYCFLRILQENVSR